MHHALIRIIEGEQNAIRFYRELIRLAPDRYAFSALEAIHDDEVGHLKTALSHFKRLFGREPETAPPGCILIRDYRSGLLTALEDELAASEMYRRLYVMTGDAKLKQFFFVSSGDETAHAIRHTALMQK